VADFVLNDDKVTPVTVANFIFDSVAQGLLGLVFYGRNAHQLDTGVIGREGVTGMDVEDGAGHGFFGVRVNAVASFTMP